MSSGNWERALSASDPITRRKFAVFVAAGLTGIALFGGLRAHRGSKSPYQSPLDEQAAQVSVTGSLDANTLTRLIGQKFLVTAAAFQTVRLTLTEIIPMGEPTEGQPEGDPFAAVFSGPANRSLAQNTYQFEHGELGRFRLFIVPGSTEDEARRYSAVFNRVASGAPGPAPKGAR